jgi:hypothetical protein
MLSVVRRPSRVVEGPSWSSSQLLFLMGARSNPEPGGGLVGCAKHLQTALHGRRLHRDSSGERFREAENRSRSSSVHLDFREEVQLQRMQPT